MIKFFLALTMLSTSAMAADLDYYDEVPLAPTGPPTVVMVRPVPVPVPVPVPASCSLGIVNGVFPPDTLIVRSGPGPEFPAIGALPEGAPVQICTALYGWGKLQGPGWVSLQYILPIQ
jgi:hypothetical protein